MEEKKARSCLSWISHDHKPAVTNNNNEEDDVDVDDAFLKSTKVSTAAILPLPPIQPPVAVVITPQDHHHHHNREELYKRLIQQALHRYKRLQQQQQGRPEEEEDDSTTSKQPPQQITKVRRSRGDKGSSSARGRSFIQTPRAHDILFGRGKFERNHVGNRQLREYCAIQLQRYDDADRVQKTNMTRKIVHDIQTKGGIFLKFRPDRQVWYEVSNKQAREKIAHMMRDVRPHRLAAFKKTEPLT